MSSSSSFLLYYAFFVGILLHGPYTTTAFVIQAPAAIGSQLKTQSPSESEVALAAAATKKKKGGYEPKWVKKKTLAEELGIDLTKDPSQVGLKGNIPVVFKQGNQTKTSMAMEGQLLRDVAIQAGQFIKYGCGKGECGTCECLIDGKWVRPCVATLPAVPKGEQYVIVVKEVKAKAPSSGKFYSARSFVIGFWNNLVGMVGFVKYRRNAKKNRSERKEYENLIKQKTLEKKMAKQKELKP